MFTSLQWVKIIVSYRCNSNLLEFQFKFCAGILKTVFIDTIHLKYIKDKFYVTNHTLITDKS